MFGQIKIMSHTLLMSGSAGGSRSPETLGLWKTSSTVLSRFKDICEWVTEMGALYGRLSCGWLGMVYTWSTHTAVGSGRGWLGVVVAWQAHPWVADWVQQVGVRRLRVVLVIITIIDNLLQNHQHPSLSVMLLRQQIVLNLTLLTSQLIAAIIQSQHRQLNSFVLPKHCLIYSYIFSFPSEFDTVCWALGKESSLQNSPRALCGGPTQPAANPE